MGWGNRGDDHGIVKSCYLLFHGGGVRAVVKPVRGTAEEKWQSYSYLSPLQSAPSPLW